MGYDDHAHLIIFQTFCFLDLSARESCFSSTFFFFIIIIFALELCRYHAWAYGYNLSLMQSNYLEMPVDTKLIQLT